MSTEYEIDNLDRQILELLQLDARTPFIEIARKLLVSGGTIHQRYDKLKKMGVIKGTKLIIDERKLGLDVTVLLGIHLKSAKELPRVIERLTTFPQVVETYYTTGKYALIVKIHTKNIKDFHLFLVQDLQSIEAIQSTESFISLDVPIKRDINVEFA